MNPETGMDAVAEVVAAFARQGIALHVALGTVPHTQLLSFPLDSDDQYCAERVDPVTGEPATNFYDYKTDPANHDPRRRIGYHYFISAHDNCVDPSSDVAEATGVAELNGNDGLVSMGTFRYYTVAPSGTPCASDCDCNRYTCDRGFCASTGTPCASASDCDCPTVSNSTCVLSAGVCVSNADRVRRYREYAGTLMHELGHNLGLCHDGPADPFSLSPCADANMNHAPNHISVMNYSFQRAWIPRSATAGTIYPLDPALPLRIDFSHGAEPQLDESNLDEGLGLDVSVRPFDRDVTRYRCGGVTLAAPSSGPIDWNCNGTIDGIVSADINGDGMIEFLRSSDEWGSLFFKFQCQPSFSD